MKKKLITGKMLIGEIVEKYPKAAEMLVTKYGLHCAGCYGAGMETLEDGARVHGMGKKEIEKMVEKLNMLVSRKRRDRSIGRRRF